MRLGIIGLPQSGKTTVFNALTRGNRPVHTGGGWFEVHTAVVNVPDPRVDHLVAMFRPEKVGFAQVSYADVAGMGVGKDADIAGPLLNQLAQMDGLLHVVRCFENPNPPHPLGSVNPRRDIAALGAELLLNDLIAVERKLERLAQEHRKGGGRDKASLQWEVALFERLHATLSAETPLREIEISAAEEKTLSGFGLLTRKPMLMLLNLGDGQDPPEISSSTPKTGLVALQGQLEMEIIRLPPEEARVFMDLYGIREPGLNRVLSLSYELLGRISFFTVGADEVRAWTVRRGATAYEAAAAIHSDLQKGFIRAEVIPWDELVELGGLTEARARGRLRLEGKEYMVRDGEVVHIRANA